MFWITEKGIDYLTHIIDKYTATSRWTSAMSRDLDILGILERRGGGYTSKQIIDFLGSRDIESPLAGSVEEYYKSIKGLERRGLIANLEGGGS